MPIPARWPFPAAAFNAASCERLRLANCMCSNSGFYGNNATVNKSMTISGNGHTVTLGAPITVNRAGAIVTLRRLALNGEDSVVRGIDITAATVVHIEHCVIYSFTSAGIRLNGTNSDLFVNDSIVRSNGTYGLFARGFGAAKLTVDNSRFERNGNTGLYTQSIESTVTRTVSSANLGAGIYVASGRMNVTSSTSANNDNGFVMATGSELLLESSVARGNSTNGLWAFDGTMTISNSVIANNVTGISKDGGATVLTRQNNTVTGNGTDTLGMLTPLGGT